MSYIDQSEYNKLLSNFGKGTNKGLLEENYVDLRPINTLDEYSSPMVMSTNDAKYPGSMEEKASKDSNIGMRSVKAGIDNNPKVTRADFIPAAKKDEGIHMGQATGPTTQTVEGMNLKGLSLDERNELKAYVESIRTTKKAIQELLDKAKSATMEGGDMSGGLMLNDPENQPEETPEEEI